ncbi:DoxX family protein [Rhodohalobacter mucosus]|uniref:DoxX family protein n=1 Tax=Rhodohalobacter mucosus TaxID=2079485 RepID=A0A316TMZ5_9BACT|nr:DoxX family protein [Rhodohalobacter mucosus]PWN05983.1 DoxX family protein [Rhodohalobacter mucosus]
MDPLKLTFSILFIAAGLFHFLRPQLFVKIMPPWVPWHRFMVFFSGFLEILFGVMLLVPSTSAIGAWGLIAVLIGVFPANIHMAVNSDQFPEIPAWLLWLRLPMQLVLIGWAWIYV